MEDARTWIEETGFCLLLPRRQYSLSIAPSFVEAVAGQRNSTPDPNHIAIAEDLLVRLEADNIAVRLNLLGQVGEQPDFVVAAWVLPYVYALRGDRDWRRSPQLTGSRQVSQLAVQTYKQLEAGDATVAVLKHALGREVTEAAVLRAITELWQQLRIIPVLPAPGKAAKWQLLRTRYQKAIAEGASTSQVTAISVLASIYLQAVIAATMEEVELFLAPLTARSKIREVLRGLVATRQVHTISMGHAPLFYVAGTLPEFTPPQTFYASAAMPASAYFMRSYEHEEDVREAVVKKPAEMETAAPTAPPQAVPLQPMEPHVSRNAPMRNVSASGKPASARPHFSRPAARSRDRKPAQSSTGNRPARHSSSEARPANDGTRWGSSAPKNGNGNGNGVHGPTSGSRSPVSSARPSRPASGTNGARSSKPAAPTWSKRNGHSNGAKPAGKATSLNGHNGSALRKDGRPAARPVRSSRKTALTAGAKAGNGKAFGFAARARQGTKKRG